MVKSGNGHYLLTESPKCSTTSVLAFDQNSTLAQRYAPTQLVEQGVWKDEPYTYWTGSGSKVMNGTIYRSVSGNPVCFMAEDGSVYRPGDSVYVDSQKPDQPFFISSIQSFKMIRRGEQLNVVLKWFYRCTEVPESLYDSLNEDRDDAFILPVADEFGKIICYERASKIRQREVFISDAVDSHSVAALRGKCVIRNFKDLSVAKREFQLVSDTFFYILGYNPENQRLATIQGEIRVGPNHQAKIPDLLRSAATATTTISTPDCQYNNDRIWEEPEWMPNDVTDIDLKSYLNAVRSVLSTRGLMSTGQVEYNGGSSSSMLESLESSFQDLTLEIALKTLHQSCYDSRRALEQIANDPLPITIEQKWSEDDTKKFVKGIRQFGKNFHKIRTELLSEKQTGELVEFYYLWKKTVGANAARPRSRQRGRPQGMLRRIKGTTQNQSKNNVSRPPSSNNQFEDHNSASEAELDGSDDCGGETNNKWSNYACHHCYCSSSKDWHHATKDRILLCFKCREHFNKYGLLPSVDSSSRPDHPPSYMFKPLSRSSEDDEQHQSDDASSESESVNESVNWSSRSNSNGIKRKSDDEQNIVVKQTKRNNSVSDVGSDDCSNRDDTITTTTTTTTTATTTVSTIDYAVATTSRVDATTTVKSTSSSDVTMTCGELQESKVDDELSKVSTDVCETVDETKENQPSAPSPPTQYETIWESEAFPFYRLVRKTIRIGGAKCFRTQTEYHMTDKHPRMVARLAEKEKEEQQLQLAKKTPNLTSSTVSSSTSSITRGYPGVTLPTASGPYNPFNSVNHPSQFHNDITSSRLHLDCLSGQFGPTEREREHRRMLELQHQQQQQHIMQQLQGGGMMTPGNPSPEQLLHLFGQQQQQQSFPYQPNSFLAADQLAAMAAFAPTAQQSQQLLGLAGMHQHHHRHEHWHLHSPMVQQQQQQQQQHELLTAAAMQQAAAMRFQYPPMAPQLPPQMGMANPASYADANTALHTQRLMQLQRDIMQRNGVYPTRLE